MTTTTKADAPLMGASVKRREDGRFITGRGNYTDDITLPGQTHAAFVRSPHAHARVKKIDASAATGDARRPPGLHGGRHSRRPG